MQDAQRKSKNNKGPWRTRGMLEGLETELDLNKSLTAT